MDLFEVIDNHVFPSIHALRLNPYRKIWEEDDSDDKEKSIKWFTYIEFMLSPKRSNVFNGYLDRDERSKKVKEEVFGDENYEIEMDLMMACIKYEEDLKRSSASYESLEAAETTLKGLNRFLRNFNPDTRTPSGALLLKPKEILSAMSELPKALKALDEARQKVNEEIKEDTKTRNNRQIGFFER